MGELMLQDVKLMCGNFFFLEREKERDLRL